MEDNYTGGDICIDGSTDCIGNDIVHGSRTDIHLKNKPRPSGRGFLLCCLFLALLHQFLSVFYDNALEVVAYALTGEVIVIRIGFPRRRRTLFINSQFRILN